MRNKQEDIRAKGVGIYQNSDFSKMKMIDKMLDDVTVNVGTYKRIDPRLGDKKWVVECIKRRNYKEMQELSNFYYRVSGIYSRLCRYMAYLYKYDWFVTPYLDPEKKQNKTTLLKDFYKVLDYLEKVNLKGMFGEIALKVIKNGNYYGYLIKNADAPTIQELPSAYCRSRMKVAGKPLVEFNMQFFDDYFRDGLTKEKMLQIFPEEFRIGYRKFRNGELIGEFQGDFAGWYPLDVNCTVKFNINGEDYPMLVSVIPAIIDLDEANDLDKKKMQQDLIKLIVQKLPIDKNGDLVFDVDEAAVLHENAVKMLGDAIGLDVLTTFADVDVADLSSTASGTADNESMARAAQNVYRESGVSEMLFDTNGNIALEKSVLNDAAAMDTLLNQFEQFLNVLIEQFNVKSKKVTYKAQFLKTTIYNYMELAKMYKEQVAMGYSKMLPQIALGLTQRTVLANAEFENEILQLSNVFIPPLQSSVMNGDTLAAIKNNQGSDNKGGRPTNEEQGKESSAKTLANKESQS